MKRQTRNIGPHIGILRFNIFVHRLLPDGSIDPEIIDCSDLFYDNEMTNRGEIYVNGIDKWDCVKRVKDKLESLNDNNGKKRK